VRGREKGERESKRETKGREKDRVRRRRLSTKSQKTQDIKKGKKEKEAGGMVRIKTMKLTPQKRLNNKKEGIRGRVGNKRADPTLQICR